MNEHHHQPDSAAETTALLEYMVKHNTSHTQELQQLADTLREQGKVDACEQLTAAIRQYDNGNAHLAEALRLVK